MAHMMVNVSPFYMQICTSVWLGAVNDSSRGEGETRLCRRKLMCQPTDQAIAIAVESYIHAPRVLSVSEVVRQVASVFPDHDTAAIVSRVIKSRQSECAGNWM
jgi:hypothetical protein